MDSKKLTPEQLAQLVQQMNGNAMMASEDAIQSGVGNDYRRNMLKMLRDLKSANPVSVQDAGKILSKPMVESGVKAAESSIDDVAKFALKKLPAAALGGVGLMTSLAAEAADSPEAGMSPEDEKIMLAEIEAMKNYDMSPASRDRKLSAIKQVKQKYLGR